MSRNASGFKKVVDAERVSINIAASESPESEHFWLPPVSTVEDSPALSSTSQPIAIAGTALTESPSILDHTIVRYGTPDESNLGVEDDAPLCSVVENSVKKSKTPGFRLASGKKSKPKKESQASLRLPLAAASADRPPPQADEPIFPEAATRPPKEAKHKVKAKSKDKKAGDGAAALEFPLKVATKRKKKHKKKVDVVEGTTVEPSVDKTVIGVTLKTALERNPSHDGVPLPAFFRYLVDFVEKYGLETEGIYRVPGVNSQVKQFLNVLNSGVEFPDIPPTSPAFSHCEKSPPKDVRGQYNPTTLERDSRLPPPFHGEAMSEWTSTSPSHSVFGSPPPHDPAVVTSVLKHFLRSLPEPVLTVEMSGAIESICDQLPDGPKRRQRLAELVHRLPRSNRYLLAWLLQHMTHVIDRAEVNKMTLANLVIVFSPTLRMSHRLLALLLSEPKDSDSIEIEIAESDLARPCGVQATRNPTLPHWLFPHSAFAYRPYKPPIPPPPSTEAFDLPDTLSELEEELFKQESLLAFTQHQIASGKASSEKDAFIWEVQHLVTKMKRKKALLELTDPAAILAELTRYEARLSRVQQELNSRPRGNEASDTSNTVSPRTASPDRASKPTNPRLPVSQFDLVSPSLASKRSSANKRASPTLEPCSARILDVGLWELQQTVAMLRRRLQSHTKKPPSPTQPPHQLVPSESLDVEEEFNFALREPVVKPDLPLPTQAAADVETLSPDRRTASTSEAPTFQPIASQDLPTVEAVEEAEEVPAPKVESFPVEWPATPVACTEEVEKAEPVEEGAVAAKEKEERESNVEDQRTQDQLPLDPASQYLLSVYNYWAVRQQELLACQHDLKSRIRSQQAEIARIEMCISQMVASGEVRERQVRQYFHENEHLLGSTHTFQPHHHRHCSLTASSLATSSDDDDGCDEDDDDDDDDDDGDEGEMAATLIQLMRDNARLEALNASHIENIIAERDSCAHLKVRPVSLPNLLHYRFIAHA
ncbi:unnamed protein product [Mesocestoides corti]|uniref:Rho-GAP domain-containing protein n=3 Tax=Mesocestoides corti TaxID=53468 RepID=A0A158QVB2_MESCO|nr:unnamed protein product [Mesocestoides corti]